MNTVTTQRRAGVTGVVGIGGALTVLVTFVVETVWGVEIPTDVSTAMTVVFCGIGGVIGSWYGEKLEKKNFNGNKSGSSQFQTPK